MTGQQSWTLEIPAPVPMKTANTREHWRATAANRKAWRDAAYWNIRAAQLPKGLARIRIDVELRFPTNRRRDASNYHPTVIKPCVDALGPGRMSTTKAGVRIDPGWALIPDDTAEYLDLAEPVIGPPADTKRYPYGLVVFTITDLSRVVTPPAGPCAGVLAAVLGTIATAPPDTPAHALRALAADVLTNHHEEAHRA